MCCISLDTLTIWALVPSSSDIFFSSFCFFKKWAIPGLFFVYFRSFQTNINTILQQTNVKKCPSSIRRWDSNPWPSDHESPPITTRPGLPPIVFVFYPTKNNDNLHLSTFAATHNSSFHDDLLLLLLLNRMEKEKEKMSHNKSRHSWKYLKNFYKLLPHFSLDSFGCTCCTLYKWLLTRSHEAFVKHKVS